jgi:folate-binding protein YgfZ
MLEQCGCKLVSDPHGPQAEPDSPGGDDSNGFISPVPALGVLQVQGEEMNSFLQGQLTNDIDKLEDGHAQWTGFCSPKGRLLATFLAVREGDTIWLLLNRELAAPIAKRLSMYVMRAKVTVKDNSASTLVFGITGDAGASALGSAGLIAAQSMQAAGNPLTIGLPPVTVSDKSMPRFLVLCGQDQISATFSSLTGDLPQRSSQHWRATEVISGIARVSAPIQESFVPQMINFELIGGVDFEKGCFTGQEVVARSQHLGKMNRRMYLANTSSTPAPGDDVLDGQGKATGTVVASAPAAAVGVDAQSVVLFESRTDAEQLEVNGEPLTAMPLPYEIPVPTPFKRPV